MRTVLAAGAAKTCSCSTRSAVERSAFHTRRGKVIDPAPSPRSPPTSNMRPSAPTSNMLSSPVVTAASPAMLDAVR